MTLLELVKDEGFVMSISDGKVSTWAINENDEETDINPADYGLQPILFDDGHTYRLGLRGIQQYENQAVIEIDQAMEVIWVEAKLEDYSYVDLK